MSRPSLPAQPQLSREPRLFEALFQNALDAVFIAEDDRRYVEVNPAACALLGVGREQLIGRRVDEFFQIEADEVVPAAW